MNIVLIGAQGSGKGTQASLLMQALDLQYVASGNLFRKAYDKKTPLGLQANAYIERGELVPDEITVAMVMQYVASLAEKQGVLLDGFPRTLAQARSLDNGFQRIGRQIDQVAYLNVPRRELLARLEGRYICRAEQHIYHRLTQPPKVEGICDIDGSELYQRSDDVGEAVQHRLDLFFHETIHVLEYYRTQEKLVEVDGNQSVPQVLSALLAAFNERRERASEPLIFL